MCHIMFQWNEAPERFGTQYLKQETKNNIPFSVQTIMVQKNQLIPCWSIVTWFIVKKNQTHS